MLVIANRNNSIVHRIFKNFFNRISILKKNLREASDQSFPYDIIHINSFKPKPVKLLNTLP